MNDPEGGGLPAQVPRTLQRALELAHVDLNPPRHQPSVLRVINVTVVAIVACLAVDDALAAFGTAVFPSTRGYPHFQFGDYAKLTVIGVVIACAAWPIVSRLTSVPRWLFSRMAVAVTLVLWLPDLYILAQGQPPRAVLVLMVMHLAIALITYNLLVHAAPAGPSSRQLTGVSDRREVIGAERRTDRPRRSLKVPRTDGYFWTVKALSTAMGEATSDYLVHTLHPVPAVLLGMVGFVAAFFIQWRAHRYVAWRYWFAVVMVGVFGTMCADVLHVGFGVPYAVSAPLFAVCLAVVFLVWHRVERTMSMHSIDTPRRELFYWAAVVATFALGTATGDLTATTFHLGYFPSMALFLAIIIIPALGYWRWGWNPVFAFWFAYVVTRPVGASFADGFGKPVVNGGLGVGDGPVALVLFLVIVVIVAYLTVTKTDVQRHVSGRVDPRRANAIVAPAAGLAGEPAAGLAGEPAAGLAGEPAAGLAGEPATAPRRIVRQDQHIRRAR